MSYRSIPFFSFHLSSACLLCILVLGTLAVTLAATAGEAVLVRDIEPSGERWTDHRFTSCPPPFCVSSRTGSHPEQLAMTLADEMFFSAHTDDTGRELWVTDGTTAGTRLVADVCPGRCPGNPNLMGILDGELIFWSGDREEASESGILGRIWRTDGSAAGTRPLEGVCEEACYHEVASLGLPIAAKVGESLVFTAPFPEGGFDEFDAFLWRTDGTSAGTRPIMVRDSEDESPELLPMHELRTVLWRGELYLHRRGLRKLVPGSDLLKRLVEPGVTTGGVMRSAPHLLAFVAFMDTPDGFDSGLWVTDGTADGSRQVLRLDGSSITPAGWVGENLYFTARRSRPDGGADHELWRIHVPADGAAGEPERLVTDLDNSYSSFVHDGKIVIHTSAGPGLHGWVVYDPETGSAPWPLVPGGIDRFSPPRPVGGVLVFGGNDESGLEPWVSDGTPKGTHRILDLNPGEEGSAPGEFARVGDTLYFRADDGIHDQELMAIPWSLVRPERCVTDGDTLCLADGRFRVRVRFTNQHAGGAQGVGTAVPGTPDAGFFWFFRESNLELMVKVLDGTGVNGYHWVFWGGITDLGYELEVEDLESDVTRTYRHVPGDLCGGADTTAFRSTEEDLASARMASLLVPPAAAAPMDAEASLAPQECGEGEERLCLGGDRSFEVEVTYRNQYVGDAEGPGHAVPLSADSGWFWFFNPNNPEVMVKVLDGTAINGHRWVFVGGLSTVRYEVRVTEDTGTGLVTRSYLKPAESTCGIADLTAFDSP